MSSSGYHQPLILNSNDIADPSAQQQPFTSHDRVTTNVGGFSTSICDFFSDPSRKADCCAITCCGLFVSDRTQYLLNKTAPTEEGELASTNQPRGVFTWTKRILLNCALPVIMINLIFLLMGFYNKEGVRKHIFVILVIVTTFVIMVFIFRGQDLRMKVRLEILGRMREEARNNNSSNSETPLSLAMDEVRQPHSNCPFHIFYSNDTVTSLVNPNSMDRGVDEEATYITRDQQSSSNSKLPPDFCSWVWKTLSNLCCGAIFGSWFQCCGMCAVGQEDRELQRLLPKQDFYIDYITFEPYANYYSHILLIREMKQETLEEHFAATSRLSNHLLKELFGGLLVFTVLTLFMEKSFMNIVIVFATFLQSFALLYFIYWKWNRFNLSLDAVIKYFCSGFVLCTGLVFTYEICSRMAIVFVYIIFFRASGVSGDSFSSAHYMQQHLNAIEWIEGTYYLIVAFFVASFTEEMSKYFSFWMVEHPDFLSPADMMITANASNTSALIGGGTNSLPTKDGSSSNSPKETRSLLSKATAIMVAMVTTSLGFACCENLMLVFLQPPGHRISNEITTLIYRSLLPLHPITAAIQSIGVIRRDVEGDMSCGLGSIILPSFLLHGVYDFAIFLHNIKNQARFVTGMVDDFDAEQDYLNERREAGHNVLLRLEHDWLWSVLQFSLLIGGALYYIKHAREQHMRLSGQY